MTTPTNPLNKAASNQNRTSLNISNDSTVLDTLKPFISAFSTKLNHLTQSLQSIDNNVSVNSLKNDLTNYFLTLKTMQHDLGSLQVLLAANSIDQQPAQHPGLLNNLTHCYDTLNQITNDSLNIQLTELQLLISSIDTYGQLLDQREQLVSQSNTSFPQPSAPPYEEESADADQQCNPMPSAPPYEEEGAQAQQQQFSPDSSAMSSPTNHFSSTLGFDIIPLDSPQTMLDQSTSLYASKSPYFPTIHQTFAEGSIELSRIHTFIADSNFCKNEFGEITELECPVTLDGFWAGDTVAILYDKNKYPTKSSLFTNPSTKHYCFNESIADYILDNDRLHPMTREPVNAICYIKIDQFTQNPESALHCNSSFQALHTICCQNSIQLAECFDDMVKEILPLHHELQTVLSYVYGGADAASFSTDELSSVSLKQRLKNMKTYYLALSYNQSGVTKDIGYSQSLQQVFDITKQLQQRCESTLDKIADLGIEQSLQSLADFCADLKDLTNRRRGDLTLADDIFLEFDTTYGSASTILSNLEFLLSSLKTQLTALLTCTAPTHIEQHLMAGLKAEIKQVEQQISHVS